MYVESYANQDAARAADTETLLAAFAEASRVYYTCGGHKLADRMSAVMTTVKAELEDRDIPVPTIQELIRRRTS